jgi:cobalt-zinc-cadmium resistance protein CzcA
MATHTDPGSEGWISRIIEAAIRNRFLVIFFVLLMGVFGVRSARQLPIDAVPDVTNVQVQVLTNAPGLPPLEVERFITFPVEETMSGMPDVEEIRSLSRFGLSAVTIVFEEGTDIHFARQLVNERLSRARGAIREGYGEPEMGPLTSGLGEIYQFEVRGEPMCAPGAPDTPECYTSMELRSLLDWQIAYQLRAIDGVVEVNSFGGDLKTYQVEVDPAQLVVHDITLEQLFEALEENNANTGGAYFVRGGEQNLIRGEGSYESLEDIRQVVLSTRHDGTPIRVGDVAKIELAPMVRQGAVSRDGRGEVVTGTVMMLTGANSRTVSEAVTARLDEVRDSLPEGVTLETYYDRTELVERTIKTVATNLLEGGVLVIVILLLLLGNVRGGLLVASIIPASMLATLIVMNQLGVSGNLMSLGALDFGLIIDGAVVIVENTVRTLGHRRTRGEESVRRDVLAASVQVARPVLFAVGIIILVYVPILTLQGIEGKMFRPMAITVITALIAALVLSLTFVPAAASWLYRNGVSEKEPMLSRIASSAYKPLLRRAMRHPWALAVIVVGGFASSLLLIPRLGAEFIPTLDEGAIALQAVRPAAVSLEESLAATDRIEESLLANYPDEVDTVISRTGRAEIATDPMGIEISDIYVMLKPEKQWKKATSKAALVASIKETLEHEVPGQNFSFSQPIELRTNELISGSRADIAINLYGPDLEELERVGDQITAVLRGVEGAADIQADQLSGLPMLEIRADRAALGRYGLNTHDVLDVVSSMGGRQVGEVVEGQQRYAIQVRLPEEARESPEVMRDLLISAPGRRMVPLGQLAQIELVEGPSVVSRSNVQRRRTIQVNVRDRDIASFVKDARARIKEKVETPPGYVVTWGGQFENLEEASERLAIAVPTALILIFALLYMTYGSLRPALLIYLNVPLATTGGLVALWARGLPLSISAAVGFIALSGIAVLNGVVMVSYFRELREEGKALEQACEEGALLRLRPILMTGLTDAIGFLPMALATSAGAEVQRPLATVVIGGLITATAITLFLLPSLYAKLGE